MDIIQGPGEYEVAGIKIKGVNLGGESNHKYIRTMYLVEMDELNLCFLGEMEKDLDESFLENMGEVDILFVEGEDVKKITTLIKDIDPRMVVSKSDTSAKALAKELGQTTEPVDRLSVKKKDLDESFLENMGEVDILFVEGEDVKKITTLIKDIDPRMVVSKSDTSAKALAKELGQTTEPVDRLSVKKKDLDENETKLIWLRDLGK
ncbi:MAG: hypothetical protein A3E61_01550 [Candidatus Colwellbacteria bacterium RIFCSPHIGHO2_12_FULL_43_12]|uniref:Uncharacterized protein n=1 Tax=Candidatus Colwellbacteria bacterium RIFCSPHIGHO2_12_FULL_43_12 TaxID=1797688 RepID=A0A1G1Z3B8_9BACT|nr:MAG: hypothetical protein A3E61_01550 [Candidatus Colwellbacteria bacterium RIFCSPHIGHO2_12_FULL_43_12]